MDWEQFKVAVTALGYTCTIRTVVGEEVASIVWNCPEPGCARRVQLHRALAELTHTRFVLDFFFQQLVAARNAQRSACGHA